MRLHLAHLYSTITTRSLALTHGNEVHEYHHSNRLVDHTHLLVEGMELAVPPEEKPMVVLSQHIDAIHLEEMGWEREGEGGGRRGSMTQCSIP